MRAYVPDLDKVLDELLSSPEPVELAPVMRGVPPLDIHATALRDAWGYAIGEKKRSPRLELSGDDPLEELLGWTVEQVSKPAVGASSVYVRRYDADVSPNWDWPLRVGIIPGFREAEARAITEAVPWRDIFDVVELTRSNSKCHLLLLPGGLRTAAGALLAQRTRIRAGMVLVAGQVNVSAGSAAALLDAIRLDVDCLGVAVASITRDKREDWFREFMRYLSHDEPVDVALFRADAYGDAQRPLLVASRRLIAAARLSTQVRRAATMVREAAEPFELGHAGAGLGLPKEALGKDIAARLEPKDMDFSGESHDASNFGRLNRSLRATTRAIPRMNESAPAPAPAPAVPAPREERRVIPETIDADTLKTVDRLGPGSNYGLVITIRAPKADDVLGPVFRDDLLPPSTAGHVLSVVFAPLPTEDAKEPARQPLIQDMFLPPTGASEPCRFAFRTDENAALFRARVILLHNNRVLQTMLYRAPLRDHKGDEPNIALTDELAVYAFDDLEGRERFDAAILLNENPGGGMGLCLMVDRKAVSVGAVGVTKEVAALSGALGALTAKVALPANLKDPELGTLLFKLANRGHLLWDSLGLSKKLPELASARRVHVVAAQPGEYLPVEFFYPRPAPQKTAVCGHAEQAILNGALDARCTTTVPGEEICPIEFWGFNRVIEHVANTDREDRFAQPLESIALFRKAILGASEKVRQEDRLAVQQTLQQLTGEPVSVATSWDNWAELVQNEAPTLLVLMPHSLIYEDLGDDMPALEIENDELPASWLEEKHVRKLGTQDRPAVLLLGCSTNLAETAFQNFAETFKRKEAAIVLSTLSLILGRHAASFASALLGAMKAAAGQNQTFGDVLLRVKRQRVKDGDPFALSLVAYGDSEIRI